MVNDSPPFHFQARGVFRSKMSLLYIAYRWVLLFYPVPNPVSFDGTLSPFTFRVTIDRYEFTVLVIPIQSLFLWIISLGFLFLLQGPP